MIHFEDFLNQPKYLVSLSFSCDELDIVIASLDKETDNNSVLWCCLLHRLREVREVKFGVR